MPLVEGGLGQAKIALKGNTKLYNIMLLNLGCPGYQNFQQQ